MTIEYYNADADGCAKAILAGCYKFGRATLLRQGGGDNDKHHRDI